MEETLGNTRHYSDPVFLAPPWPDLFVSDAERQHDFAAAADEYDRLHDALDRLGYETILLPKTTVAERCAFVLERIALPH
jgi:predicted ATPase